MLAVVRPWVLSVERLLDPANPSVTLLTLERAASAVGKRLRVQLTA